MSINAWNVLLIALDPSSYWDPNALSIDDYIDATDATFVDIIHTDSPEVLNRGAGIRQSIGDADFYPNNGLNSG